MATVEERFQAKYRILENGCWEWLATTQGTGYGIMRVDSIYQLAHRVSYKLYKGEIPQGLIVRHKCDHKYCVNPEHLELGTQKDNVHDMCTRGRNTRRALTSEQVQQVKEMLAAGLSWNTIAFRMGSNKRTIGRIAHGQTYVLGV